MTRILLTVGTRPEIIKMGPVIHALQKAAADFTFVHTGQHYDYSMSRKMIEDLELPSPGHTFRLASSSPVNQMAEMMTKLAPIIYKERARIVLVEGDTNTVVAVALAALKMGIKVAHVESGLRSRDWRMPEEHNRIMVDHVSDVLFAPTSDSERNLRAEHVHGKIFVTGNTVIDAALQYMPIAEKTSKALKTIHYSRFILATAHRAENVDDPLVLKELVETLIKAPFPVVFPAHPRTVKRLRQFGLYSRITGSANVQVIPPPDILTCYC